MKCVGSVLGECRIWGRKCVRSAMEVSGKCVGSVLEVCGKCVGSAPEVLVEAKLEAISGQNKHR